MAQVKAPLFSCASTSFYNPLMYSYFGYPNNSKIEFELNGKTRSIKSEGGNGLVRLEILGITGFIEGSLIFGNRFKDVDFSRLKILASVRKKSLL